MSSEKPQVDETRPRASMESHDCVVCGERIYGERWADFIGLSAYTIKHDKGQGVVVNPRTDRTFFCSPKCLRTHGNAKAAPDAAGE